MKVVLLAGGKGSRLGNLTDTLPKPLIKIGGKPILWHIMKTYAYYGFKEFIICTGYKSSLIKSYFFHYNTHKNDFTINLANSEIAFHNQASEDWKVTLIDTGLNTHKGGRIKRIEPYLDSDTNMLTYADGLADINIKDLLHFHEHHGKLITITGVSRDSKFGEIIEKNNKVLTFEEKPNNSLINGGFMVFNKELLRRLTENSEFERKVLKELAAQGEVMVYKHYGNWACMDTYKEYLSLNALWDNKDAFWKKW
ncbi:MAG: putative glucose-1-phosphate cytidylyltransferase [Promethearchaeota archaeon]|nr:MAG: putative glucose-1-phosphate cytidylyltransferase [Candidatus Lokiarchaeota archaeon]